MITKIVIDKIYVNVADKAGTAFVSKASGRPQSKIDIYAQNLPEGVKSVSGFVDKESPAVKWQPGMEITVRLLKSKDGKWWNFSAPSETDMKLQELEDRIAELEEAVFVSDEAAADKVVAPKVEIKPLISGGIMASKQKELTAEEIIKKLKLL